MRWTRWFVFSLIVAGVGNVTLTVFLLLVLPAVPAELTALVASVAWGVICGLGGVKLESWVWWRRWDRQMRRELAALESQVRSHLDFRAEQVMSNRMGKGGDA